MRCLDWIELSRWGQRTLLAFGLAAGAAGGCGGGGGATVLPTVTPPDLGDPTPVADATSYFPLTAGASWQFNIVRQGLPKNKTQTVDGTETMTGSKSGIMAVRLKEIVDGDTQLTWFERKGSATVNHRQQEFDAAANPKYDELYDPYDIRLEEGADRVAAGSHYTVTYNVARADSNEGDSTKQKIHDFTVEAAGESVTVPAGTFTTIRVRRSDPTDGSYRQYWYARGLGKVKEVDGNGDTEELAGYSGLTPAP